MENSVIWNPGMKIEALEQLVILKAYRFYHRNKTATANSLGISIRTLDNKLEKYEMLAIEQEAADDARRQDRQHQLERARGIHSNNFDTGSTPRFDPRAQIHDETSQGLRLESIANTAEKSTMPMQVRKKV